MFALHAATSGYFPCNRLPAPLCALALLHLHVPCLRLNICSRWQTFAHAGTCGKDVGACVFVGVHACFITWGSMCASIVRYTRTAGRWLVLMILVCLVVIAYASIFSPLPLPRAASYAIIQQDLTPDCTPTCHPSTTHNFSPTHLPTTPYTHAHTHAYTHIHTHTHTHTNTHTHIHTAEMRVVRSAALRAFTSPIYNCQY